MAISTPSSLCFLSSSPLALSVLGILVGWAILRPSRLSILVNYAYLIVTHLKSAWDVCLNRAFFGHLDLSGADFSSLNNHIQGSRRYNGPIIIPDQESSECAVCLCKMEPIPGTNETRELPCHHVFHKVCIERWLGFNRMSCPLCRSFVNPWRAVTELGAEVLFFQFSDVSSTKRGDMWWLR